MATEACNKLKEHLSDVCYWDGMENMDCLRCGFSIKLYNGVCGDLTGTIDETCQEGKFTYTSVYRMSIWKWSMRYISAINILAKKLKMLLHDHTENWKIFQMICHMTICNSGNDGYGKMCHAWNKNWSFSNWHSAYRVSQDSVIQCSFTNFTLVLMSQRSGKAQ